MAGKHVASHGHALALGTAVFTAAGSSTLIKNSAGSGTSSDTYVDVYSIEITSTDTAPQTVTISDGATALEYEVASPSPVMSNPLVPWRFRKGADLTATLGALTASKRVSVVVRGVQTST